jgi:hypothetical protein
MIFFVSWIADAMILKEDIGRWLCERDRIVKSFHGHLSPESKVDIPKFQSSEGGGYVIERDKALPEQKEVGLRDCGLDPV